MTSLKDYFDSVGYVSKYDIGDRITGKWNDIPFMGTVGNDTRTNLTDGPYVTVHLDLPIKTKTGVRTIIHVKHKDIKKLKSFD